MVSVTVDISYERALEKRLVESEEKFQTVIDRLPVLAWMTDEQGHLTIKNTLWLDYLGLSGGAKDWATFENLIDPVEFGDYTKEWQACVALGHLLEREINLSDKLAGKYVRHKLTAIPFHRDDGTIAGWVGTAVPIT